MNTLVPGTPLLVESNHKEHEEKGTGLPSSYRRYCIRLYALVSRPRNAKREYIPMALREDIAKLDRYIEQMDFLYQHRLDDRQSLQSMRDSLRSELNGLIYERRKLYSEKKRAVRNNWGSVITQKNIEISNKSRKIRELRKKLSLCEAVIGSSDRVLENVDTPTKAPVTEKSKVPIKPNNQRKR